MQLLGEQLSVTMLYEEHQPSTQSCIGYKQLVEAIESSQPL